MPAVPKKRHSSGRRDRRRSHLALTPQNLVKCSNCSEMRQQHHVCPKCGWYGSKQVIAA